MVASNPLVDQVRGTAESFTVGAGAGTGAGGGASRPQLPDAMFAAKIVIARHNEG
jgi:hypothetical protein